MKRSLTILILLGTFLGGCSISFTSSKRVDGGIFRSTDFGETWEQRVFVGTEKKKTLTISAVDVSGIYFSPADPESMVITTYASGLYHSTDAGGTWVKDGLRAANVTAFVFDPSSPTIQYAGSGPNIYKTTDGGPTWDIIYTDTRGEGMSALYVNTAEPSTVLAVTSSGTILKSTNYGVEWKVLTSIGDSIKFLFPSRQDANRLYALTNSRGLFRSLDGGQNWKELDGLRQYPGAEQVNWLTASPFFPDTVYVATNYGILKSVNGGDAWAPIKTLIPFGTVPIKTVAVDPIDSKIIYFSVEHLLHRTDDGGQTWKTIESIPTSRRIQRLVTHPTQPGVLFFGTLLVKK
ncbi:MAG: hypothetical protein HY566_02205 [Candidatus Kerfeldbacteria bacterium]|nr:hypothetical protein [Candidatus Kerfeldbacteria bacterium]